MQVSTVICILATLSAGAFAQRTVPNTFLQTFFPWLNNPNGGGFQIPILQNAVRPLPFSFPNPFFGALDGSPIQENGFGIIPPGVFPGGQSQTFGPLTVPTTGQPDAPTLPTFEGIAQENAEAAASSAPNKR